MTRLFGLPEAYWDPPARYVDGYGGRAAGQLPITFTDGTDSAVRETAIPSDPDPDLQRLHRRRAARRLCKQTLYDLLRQMTGIHPPWGSLTGVRPTHLMLEALAEGLAPEEAVDRIVDRFDVLRPKAELLAEIALTQRKLPAPGDRWMDVYIGIPFCTTRCAYCSFSSGEIGDGSLVGAVYGRAGKGNPRLRAGSSAAAGGRSAPCMWAAARRPPCRRMISAASWRWSRNASPGRLEYTVEAGRPDTLTREKLRAIREAGISRISINPQTMNDRTLQVIGRAHTAQQVRDAYALAREEGLPHINMDVIAGLPGENEEDFARTMEEAVPCSRKA